MREAGNLFDCPRRFKSCFNAYVLSSNLEYCALVWISSAESHLRLLDNIVRSAERLCEGELCCLEHRRKISAMCLLYKTHHSAGLPFHKYLQQFAAAYYTRVSAALCELALVIPSCKTDQFSQLFLPVTVRL